MPNSDKTPGERLVEEWRKQFDTRPPADWLEFQHTDLAARIDSLVDELSRERVLDLRKTGPFDSILDAIRTQLPGVKVIV